MILQYSQQPTSGPYQKTITPIHTLNTEFQYVHLNIILPLKPRPSSWSLSLHSA